MLTRPLMSPMAMKACQQADMASRNSDDRAPVRPGRARLANDMRSPFPPLPATAPPSLFSGAIGHPRLMNQSVVTGSVMRTDELADRTRGSTGALAPRLLHQSPRAPERFDRTLWIL